MNLKLEIIPLDADTTQPAFASDDCQLLLKMWKEYYPTIGFHLPWVGYMVKQEEEIIGCCSFNGPPVEDSVEISYWTFKPFEGRGIASFSCKQLIAIAREENSTVTIFAKTAPGKKCFYFRTGKMWFPLYTHRTGS